MRTKGQVTAVSPLTQREFNCVGRCANFGSMGAPLPLFLGGLRPLKK